MIVYKIENQLNGKSYVGQTVREARQRFSEHARSNSPLGRAMRKYGVENFTIQVLDEAGTMDELNAKEIEWVSRENTMTPIGYNLCIGGGSTEGFNHGAESKAAMSAKKQGKFHGAENPFYGEKHTEETRAKMKMAWTSERKNSLAEMSRARNIINQAVRVRNIDTGEIFDSVIAAAEFYNLKSTHITRVCRARRRTTGGYGWEYVDKVIPSQAD